MTPAHAWKRTLSSVALGTVDLCTRCGVVVSRSERGEAITTPGTNGARALPAMPPCWPDWAVASEVRRREVQAARRRVPEVHRPRLFGRGRSWT